MRKDIKKVLLINPPWYRIFGQSSNRSPLGLCYIASVLEKEGYDVHVYNADFKKKLAIGAGFEQVTSKYSEYLRILKDTDHPLWQEVGSVIFKESPDIVGISVTTAKYGSALNVSKIVKDFDPDIPVTWGGVHPTILPNDVIKNKNVDIVVRGEGEFTFLDIVKNPSHLSQIAGITYKEYGKIINNKDRPLIENLNALPFPAKHLLLEKSECYPEDFGNIFASRGCPYNCIFCASHKVWTKRVRYRSPRNVVDEIKTVKKEFKTKIFSFDDDSFTLNRQFVEELCDLLIKEGLKISWSTETRANLVHDDLMKKMKSAGCEELYIGAESGDEETLRLMKKGVTVEQILSANRTLNKNKIRCSAFFMVGFPWETKKEIEKTVSFMRQLNPRSAILSVATPYPGTELYDICMSEGLLSDNIDWSTFFHQSPDMYFTKKMTRSETIEVIKEVERIFEAHNSQKMKELIRSDPLWILRRIIKGKYRPQDLWTLFKHNLFP
jgi:anaerobic magnesium-protoporphyrin IX monomethyl ester cyclase